MELTLFIVFLILTLLIITIGLFRPEHTELALVGFLFLFFLSLIMMLGDIQYKTGINETMTYSCLCCDAQEGAIECSDAENASLVVTSIESVNTYTTFEGGGTFSHTVGYWLAIASFVGFLGVILGLRSQFKNEENR